MRPPLHPVIILFVLSCALGACYDEQEVPVSIDFEYVIPSDGYTVPVSISLINRTSGADFYQWTFSGATPATSDKKNPGVITYSHAGAYTITLEAWNDTQRRTKEITLQLDSAVTIDFDFAIELNDFVPANVTFSNGTVGGSSFAWTFEGGEPSSSTERIPPQVMFKSPGEHLVTLDVSNGREMFSLSKTVSLKAAMSSEFVIVPSLEDEDYEAPLVASLQNLSTNALAYSWTCPGATISDPSASDPEIYFDSPGEYTVTLTADNGKETQVVQRSITVKENSNLFIVQDIKLGVSAAHNSIGSFYSSKLKKVLRTDEITAETGKLVDFGLFAINSGFSYCRFISPDSAAKFAFPAIADAIHTSVVNTLESTEVQFSSSDFQSMTEDTALHALSIADHDTGAEFFQGTPVPRIVLFETADGRKGAIMIKAFVAEGSTSYVTADIKIQKERRDP